MPVAAPAPPALAAGRGAAVELRRLGRPPARRAALRRQPHHAAPCPGPASAQAEPEAGVPSGVFQPSYSHTVRTSSLRLSAEKHCPLSSISAIAYRLRRSPAKVVVGSLRMRGGLQGTHKN